MKVERRTLQMLLMALSRKGKGQTAAALLSMAEEGLAAAAAAKGGGAGGAEAADADLYNL